MIQATADLPPMAEPIQWRIEDLPQTATTKIKRLELARLLVRRLLVDGLGRRGLVGGRLVAGGRRRLRGRGGLGRLVAAGWGSIRHGWNLVAKGLVPVR